MFHQPCAAVAAAPRTSGCPPSEPGESELSETAFSWRASLVWSVGWGLRGVAGASSEVGQRALLSAASDFVAVGPAFDCLAPGAGPCQAFKTSSSGDDEPVRPASAAPAAADMPVSTT